jgi:hypothetical protein
MIYEKMFKTLDLYPLSIENEKNTQIVVSCKRNDADVQDYLASFHP